MFSDVICEQLVKRKFSTIQIIKGVLITLAGLILSFLLYGIGLYADPAVGLMGPMFFICGMIGTFFIFRRFMLIEYEYSFVNGELTIDKISAKSTRKHLTDINVKSFEKLGKYDPEVVEKINADVVKDYSSDKYDDDSMYAYFKDDASGRKTLLIFTPNKKLIDSMKNYVSATVYREAFSVAKKN